VSAFGVLGSWIVTGLSFWLIYELFKLFSAIFKALKGGSDEGGSGGGGGRNGQDGRDGRDGASPNIDLRPITSMLQDIIDTLRQNHSALMLKLEEISRDIKDLVNKQESIIQGLRAIKEQIEQLEATLKIKAGDIKDQISDATTQILDGITKLGTSIVEAIKEQTKALDVIIRSAIEDLEQKLGKELRLIIEEIEKLRKSNHEDFQKIAANQIAIIDEIAKINRGLASLRSAVLNKMSTLQQVFSELLRDILSEGKKTNENLEQMKSRLNYIIRLAKDIGNILNEINKQLAGLGSLVTQNLDGLKTVVTIINNNNNNVTSPKSAPKKNTSKPVARDPQLLINNHSEASQTYTIDENGTGTITIKNGGKNSGWITWSVWPDTANGQIIGRNYNNVFDTFDTPFGGRLNSQEKCNFTFKVKPNINSITFKIIGRLSGQISTKPPDFTINLAYTR